MSYFTLGSLIECLKAEDPSLPMPIGFGEPKSYRGYYEQLAFEPKRDTTIGEMLAHAEAALGQTFQGYKGGDFTMGEHTDCWIAEYGHGGGDMIGQTLMACLIGQAKFLNTHMDTEKIKETKVEVLQKRLEERIASMDREVAVANKRADAVEEWRRKREQAYNQRFIDSENLRIDNLELCEQNNWLIDQILENSTGFPMQPIIWDKHGVARFKANKLVEYLLDKGGIDLNQLAMLQDEIENEHYVQFAQLHGYSVSGAGDLTALDESHSPVIAVADAIVERMLEEKKG